MTGSLRKGFLVVLTSAAIGGSILLGGCSSDSAQSVKDVANNAVQTAMANGPKGGDASAALGAPSTNGDISVLFSPRGGVEAAIVNSIRSAQKSIYIQAYSFTSRPIGNALIDAHKRGVEIHVIVDKSQVRTDRRREGEDKTGGDNSLIPLLLSNGIKDIRVDYKPAIAHNKIMIIDGKLIITGSYNFTNSANIRNAENCLFIRNHPDLVKRYMEDWRWRYGESAPVNEYKADPNRFRRG